MSRSKAALRLIAAATLVLPLVCLLLSAVFAIMIHAVEICPKRVIAADCELKYWNFGDAFIYVAGKFLFLDISPTVRIHSNNGTVEHTLRPSNPVGTTVDFVVSMAAIIFLGAAVGIFCEMEFVEHMVAMFSCGQHHRKTYTDESRLTNVSLACELFAAGAYCFFVVPLFVGLISTPFGAIIAAFEGWTFVDGYRYLIGVLIRFPAVSSPTLKYHHLGTRISLFIVGNLNFNFVYALTLALLAELPLAKKMSRLFETRLCLCGRGDKDIRNPESELEGIVEGENSDPEENLLHNEEKDDHV